MSLYPFLFYEQNSASKSLSLNQRLGSSVIVGAAFGVAKSVVTTAFVFIAAPLCALVIVFMRGALEEREVGKEEVNAIGSWSERTILRFIKGTFSSLCLIPLLCMTDHTSFVVAALSSFVTQGLLGEVVFVWWVVKKEVKKGVGQRVRALSDPVKRAISGGKKKIVPESKKKEVSNEENPPVEILSPGDEEKKLVFRLTENLGEVRGVSHEASN